VRIFFGSSPSIAASATSVFTLLLRCCFTNSSLFLLLSHLQLSSSFLSFISFRNYLFFVLLHLRQSVDVEFVVVTVLQWSGCVNPPGPLDPGGTGAEALRFDDTQVVIALFFFVCKSSALNSRGATSSPCGLPRLTGGSSGSITTMTCTASGGS